MNWRKIRTGLLWTAVIAALVALRLSFATHPGHAAPAGLIRLFSGGPAGQV